MSDNTPGLECELCMGEWGGGSVSRREFASMSIAAAAAAGASMALPGVANAAGLPLTESDVTINTTDGTCDGVLIRPTSGTHAGVLLWPDAPSLREALREMGRRIATEGYAVLIPNVFYRAYTAPLTDKPISADDKELANKIQTGVKQLTADAIERDAKSMVRFLDAQPSVSKSKKLGVTGYCLGGPFVLRTAALFPDRVGAAGIFHGARMVTDKPDSPHLLIPKMKARFYIAVASEDDAKEPTVKDTLRTAFDAAHLPATIEVYKGTAHAWTISDFPVIDGKVVHDPAQAERAMNNLLALYKKNLA